MVYVEKTFLMFEKNKNDVTLVLSTPMRVCSVISRVRLFVSPWIVALQAALSAYDIVQMWEMKKDCV